MTKRRLIESGLPLAEVNAESAREKSLRHGHISTMHLWWARRPLAMSRTVVFASLLPDPPEASARADILKSIAQASSFEDSIKPERINPLKGLLAEAFGRPPRVLDCFAGGGAIPLESLRLGCDTTALDLNPVAHLIQRCVLEYPQLFGDAHGLEDNRLASEVVQWADWVRRRAEPRIAEVFPPDADGDRPAVYFWAHTMRCSNPSCGAEVPLLSSFWLANSSRRLAWVEASTGSTGIVLRVRSGAPPASHPTDAGTMRAASMTCPACETTTPAKEVRAYARKTGFGRRLYAVLDVSSRVRTYRAPRPEESWECLADRVTPLLDQLEDTADGTSAIPDEPVDSIGYINLQNLVYGYDTWRSLFSPRQLLVLGTLADSVRAAHVEMLASGLEPARARAIATYLGFLVDKIADYDSEFTSWRTTAEASRSTFPRQAISIAWDFIEIYPFHPDSDVWGAHVRWLELAIRHCSMTGNTPARVVRGDAQSLPFEDETFDAVVIDPPYYFSVMYSDLSDFFYVWLKRSVGHLYPDVFLTQWTPKDQEVIQNRTNPKDPRYISSEEFERRLERSLREVVRVVRRDGVVSIVFAHTDVVAWERLLRSLQAVGLVVSTSWPMRSERAGRQLAQVKAALGSSVVLVCRPQETAEEGFYDDVVRELEHAPCRSSGDVRGDAADRGGLFHLRNWACFRSICSLLARGSALRRGGRSRRADGARPPSRGPPRDPAIARW